MRRRRRRGKKKRKRRRGGWEKDRKANIPPVCVSVQEDKENRNAAAVGTYQLEVETSALVWCYASFFLSFFFFCPFQCSVSCDMVWGR